MDKKIVKTILNEASVVCTTCSSAGSKIFDETKFCQLLVDEASQATEPAILVPISRGINHFYHNYYVIKCTIPVTKNLGPDNL